MVETARVGDWDAELDRLVAEARPTARASSRSRCPASLSATAVARLRDDPDQFARELARPMPRQPSPAARFGTRFHAWVEARFGQQSLLDPDDLPGRGDLGHRRRGRPARADRACSSPDRSAIASRTRSRRRSRWCWPGRWCAAASTRSTPKPDGGWLVIDWKTNRQQTADPLQLALYRLAWAELLGVPLERVSAGFHYVRSGETVLPPDLPDRDGLEDLLRGPAPG